MQLFLEHANSKCLKRNYNRQWEKDSRKHIEKTNLYTEKNFNKKQLPGKSQKEKKQISIFTFDECLILCEEFQREFDFRETNANKNQSS